MTRYFVGVDVGTTATKAVLLAGDGAVLRRVRAPHVAGLPLEPGRVDPVSWWGSVQEACRALQAGDLELDGIGLSVHSPVAVPMDAAGKHVSAGYRFETPGLTDIVKAAEASFTPEEAAGMGNRTFPATFMVASYLLMQEQEPEAAREVHVLGSVGTYIGHKLAKFLLGVVVVESFGRAPQSRLIPGLGVAAMHPHHRQRLVRHFPHSGDC